MTGDCARSAGKQKVAQVRIHVARAAVDDHRVAAVAHRVEHRPFRVELLALLVVIGDLDVGAASDLAPVRRQVAEQQPQQRRFARAVRSDQANPIAADDTRRKIPNHRVRSECLRDMVGLEHNLARRVSGFDLQAYGGRLLASRRPLLPHGHQRADAPFVARPPRLDALAQPRFLFRQALVELVLRDRFVGQPLVLLSQERRVVARPRGELPAVDFDDPRRDALEERAVVSHEYQRTRIVREKCLQPDDCVEIEVIGRLVEQQHIRLGDQRPCEQHTAPPSARKRVDADIRRQLEARQHELDPLFDAPSVGPFELVLQAPQLLELGRRTFLGQLDGRVVIARHEIAQVAKRVGDDVEDGATRRDGNILIEPGHAEARLGPHGPGIRSLLAGDNPQQRRLAGAVPADHADAFASLDPERGVAEQR